MSWDAVTAVAEMVGATAVVVTLLYLAIQVRQSTRAVQAATFQATSAMDHDFLLAVGKDPTTARAWFLYLTAPESLSQEDELQGRMLFGSALRRLENVYFQYRLGTLAEGAWISRQGMYKVVANSPGYAAFLRTPTAAFLDGDFVTFMAELRSAHVAENVS